MLTNYVILLTNHSTYMYYFHCVYSDIGFVIARTASDAIRIVNSYGYWEEGLEGERRSSASLLTTPVRVSSDSLWRRSPRHRFQPTTRSASVQNVRLELAVDDVEINQWKDSAECVKHSDAVTASLPDSARSKPRINRAQSMPSAVNSPSNGDALYAAILSKDLQKVEAAFERDHHRSDMKGQSGHYVICSRSLSDAVSIANFLRVYVRRETINSASRGQPIQEVRVVFLMAYKPTAEDLLVVSEESSADLLRNVLVVVGSPARSNDIVRVEATKARQVVILPLDKSVSREGDHASTFEVSEFGLSGQSNWTDDERLADFGVICSLLAVEINQQGLFRRVSPRRQRQSSRLESDGKPSPTAHTAFKRELEQGIPLESVKLRALGRFPGPDPGGLRENCGSRAGNTLSVLHYACNAKLCRPCDEAVQDDFPSLTPSFAGGKVFLASLLNRIVCQAFYNPYITDVVEALANGSGPNNKDTNVASKAHRAFNVDSSNGTPRRRLFDVELEDEFAGAAFIDVFVHFIAKEMLVVGVLRHTSSELDNLLPFVYTCPSSSTVMHSKDRLFVLG
jgi:hypothetical protein